jgi:phage tail protein X
VSTVIQNPVADVDFAAPPMPRALTVDDRREIVALIEALEALPLEAVRASRLQSEGGPARAISTRLRTLCDVSVWHSRNRDHTPVGFLWNLDAALPGENITKVERRKDRDTGAVDWLAWHFDGQLTHEAAGCTEAVARRIAALRGMLTARFVPDAEATTGN